MGLAVDAPARAATYPWRSVTVAGGAFPPSLSDLTAHVVTALPRHETELWQRVAARTPRPLPDFADHGVTHPHLPRRRGFGRAVANLRYTHGPTWKVVRALKGMDTVGLCRDLAPIAAWPADPDDLPWGDQQLLARACGREPRPGAPKNWRAWDTSHHLGQYVAPAGAMLLVPQRGAITDCTGPGWNYTG